jgi:hypothetical protein
MLLKKNWTADFDNKSRREDLSRCFKLSIVSSSVHDVIYNLHFRANFAELAVVFDLPLLGMVRGLLLVSMLSCSESFHVQELTKRRWHAPLHRRRCIREAQ